MSETVPSRSGQPEQDSSVTLVSLNQVSSEELARLSLLSLPEVEALKQEVATVLPAGNLPGLILTGLTAIKARRLSHKQVKENINALFAGSSLLSESFYSLMLAGPAVVLSAYQRLLELAGKDVESAFPEGTWQFYLQFGLREDPGRHTNETIAYHKERPQQATVVDDMTTWIMTAISTLFDTYALTATLWQEWTTLRLINEAADRHDLARQPPFRSMLRDWTHARPYDVSSAGDSYAARRLAQFEEFSSHYYASLPLSELGTIGDEVQRLGAEKQPAYQRQMNLLGYLKPGKFQDDRIHIPIWDAKVGLVWKGHIYLIDACATDEQGRLLAFSETGERWVLNFNRRGEPLDRRGKPLVAQGGWLLREDPGSVQATPVGYLAPPDPATVKGIVEHIVAEDRPPATSEVDLRLVRSPRSEQERLRKLLPAQTQVDLAQLSHAPIIVNWDEQDLGLPLGEVRRDARRGIGDHPLTVMRTRSSVIFDQSHIFFDGIWGMAIAEVMTNLAVAWSKQVVKVNADLVDPLRPLRMDSAPQFSKETDAIAYAPDYAFYEVDAETSSVDMVTVQQARKFLKQRGIRLTINDMLVLSRVFHANNYAPADFVLNEVRKLPEPLRSDVIDSVEGSGGYNPALLIPMDASFVDPRERVFPTTFRNAITGIHDVYSAAVAALVSYQEEPGAETWYALDRTRREYFAYLNAFGELLNTYKDVAMSGESINTAILRLLGNLPVSMQYALDQIPQRVTALNEVIKGEEVFSNVGRVAVGSSLSRFLSAKDDGKAKRFVWGILTDDNDRMTVTLRDFRPHVPLLIRAGHQKLAQKLANDYVLTYVAEVNQLAMHLSGMAIAESDRRWSQH